MATAQLSTLLPQLSVPACPTAVQLAALRQACRRFCLDTEWWKEDLSPITSVSKQAEYTLTPGYANVEFVRVLRVWVDGATRLERTWCVMQGNVLTLAPAPDRDGRTIEVRIVYAPRADCTEVLDELLARWGDTIAAAADAALMGNAQAAGNPVQWFNPQGAAYREDVYRDGVFRAKSEMLSQMQSGPVDAEKRNFFL